MELSVYKSLIAFLIVIALIKLFKPISQRVGLVDTPDDRKQHAEPVPLIGGLAIFLTLVIVCQLFSVRGGVLNAYFCAAGLITLVGILDDRFDLSVRTRVIASFVASAIMVFWGRIYFENLGNLLGFGELVLPTLLAVPFTLVATFGVINAFNMMDGIDGLSSGVSAIALVAQMIMLDDSTPFDAIAIILVAAISGFTLFNLQLFPRFSKVFMGDAGSMLLGFTLISIICTTDQYSEDFHAVTGLYLLALPLMDMVATVIRRVRRRNNPFKGDRSHGHHRLQHRGFSHRQALGIMLTIALIFSVIGVVLHKIHAPQWLQFGLFLILFVLYYVGVARGFGLSFVVRRQSFGGA